MPRLHFGVSEVFLFFMFFLCSKKIKSTYVKYVGILENWASPVFLLTVRIWIGLVFLKSGLTKFSNVDQAINLFTYEYTVPLLPPAFAAILSMIVEIGCGAALIVGLLTRITALPLIGMTLVIQLFVFQNPEHFYWLFLLATLAIYGGGKISADCLATRICKSKAL
jgi:putative oxidoreductase